jgi:hypothetical protein
VHEGSRSERRRGRRRKFGSPSATLSASSVERGRARAYRVKTIFPARALARLAARRTSRRSCAVAVVRPQSKRPPTPRRLADVARRPSSHDRALSSRLSLSLPAPLAFPSTMAGDDWVAAYTSALKPAPPNNKKAPGPHCCSGASKLKLRGLRLLAAGWLRSLRSCCIEAVALHNIRSIFIAYVKCVVVRVGWRPLTVGEARLAGALTNAAARRSQPLWLTALRQLGAPRLMDAKHMWLPSPHR